MQFKSVLFALSLFGFTVRCMAQNLYVSSQGNDKNPGSIQKPFRSLEKAKKAVAQYFSAHQNKPAQPVTVYLRGGIYYLDSTLVLNAKNSGTKEAPITYSAYKNEVPVISGGKIITGWKPLTENLPEILQVAKGKLWVADIPKGWLFHYLYINGKQAVRSQSDHHFWRNWNKDHVQGKPEKEGQLITFTNKEQLKYLPSNGDAEMVCIMAQYGIMGNGVVTNVDPDKGTLRWNSRQVNVRPSRDPYERGYRFENALCFIDRPGDWAVDSKAGKVYYYPNKGENLLKSEVIAPKLNELIRLQGDEIKNQYVHDVKFNRIKFIYTDRLPENQWPYAWLMRQWENVDATIYMTGTQNCSLMNSKILYSGAYGLTINHYGQQNRIEGNEIGYTGSGGIFLEGYGPGTLDVNKENIITRNYVHDHGLGNYWHSPSIQIYQSGSNTISYNLLQRSAYNSISIDGLDPARLTDTTFAIPGAFEGQVQKWNMAQPRFNDFPQEMQQGLRKGAFSFDRETIKPYLHSNKNLIEYNIISEPETLLSEGGAIYAWCIGKENIWRNNVIFKSHGMPASSVLALDNLAEYTTIENNVFWVEGEILNGVGARKEERGNTISNNIRVNFKKEYGARQAEKVGSWWINELGRKPLDELINKISHTVAKNGGWMGNPSIGVPAVGEPISLYGESEELPKGAHVTIE